MIEEARKSRLDHRTSLGHRKLTTALARFESTRKFSENPCWAPRSLEQGYESSLGCMPKSLMQTQKRLLSRLGRWISYEARNKAGQRVLRSGTSCGIHPYLRRLGCARRIPIQNYASINLRINRTFLTMYNSTISIKSRDTPRRLTYSGVART